jgi:hypothetical protein
MGGDMQKDYKHGVPKQLGHVHPRISVTFRKFVIPAKTEEDKGPTTYIVGLRECTTLEAIAQLEGLTIHETYPSTVAGGRNFAQVSFDEETFKANRYDLFNSCEPTDSACLGLAVPMNEEEEETVSHTNSSDDNNHVVL